MLGLNTPRTPLSLQTEIWDENRDLVWFKKGESHSFNRNYNNHMVTQMMDVDVAFTSLIQGGVEGHLALIDVTGTTRTASSPFDIGSGNSNGSGFHGDVGDSTSGIVVGTGTSGFTFEDYQLGGPILSGSAVGQLNYSSAEVTTISYDTGTDRFNTVFARFFNNNTTAAIVVNEIGMVSYMAIPTNVPVLMCRDVLSTAISIPAGGQLKVTYTFASQSFAT